MLTKSFFFQGTKDKGSRYRKTLMRAGYIRQGDYRIADFLLFDYERHGEKRVRINTFVAQQKPTFIYPHAAVTEIIWDGIVHNLVSVNCNFAFGTGQIDVMRAYSYPYRIEACGWPYSEVREFTPTTGKKLLFAPMHPNRSMSLMPEDKKAVKKVAGSILKNIYLFDEITIRYGGTLEESGLEGLARPEFKFKKAIYHISDAIQSIEAADIIVSSGTFAYLSVALGKPTIFYNQEAVPHNMAHNVRSYDKYKEIRWYPLELFSTEDINILLKQTCRGDPGAEDWKRRFIGGSFNEEKFLSVIREYV